MADRSHTDASVSTLSCSSRKTGPPVLSGSRKTGWQGAIALIILSGLLFSISACSQSALPTLAGPKQNRLVAKVEIHPSSTIIAPDEIQKLAAVVKSGRGQVVNGRSVTWSSSDTSVVQIDASGTIVAGNEGSATIQANVQGVVGTATVDVRGEVVAIEFDAPEARLSEGEQAQLQATFLYKNGARRSAGQLRWVSSARNILHVDGDGLATARETGLADALAIGRGKVGTIKLTIDQNVPSSLTLSASALELTIGDSVQLLADVKDKKGNRLSRSVKWFTTDPAMVTVDNGLVRGIGAGSAIITAKSGGVMATADINVVATDTASGGESGGDSGGGTSSGPALPATLTDLHAAGATYNTVSLRFTQVANGQGQPASYLIRYLESPLGSWDAGLDVTKGSCAGAVAGTAIGATLTCTVEGLQGPISYDFQAVALRGSGSDRVLGAPSNVATVVTDDPPLVLDIVPSSFQIEVGQTQQLTCTVTDVYGNGVDLPMMWTSGNLAVASVGAMGLVAALAAGSSAISCSAGGTSDFSQGTIVAPPSGGDSSSSGGGSGESGGGSGGGGSGGGGSGGGGSGGFIPSGPWGAGPNEPPGMAEFFSTDGTTKNLGSQWFYGKKWGDINNPTEPISATGNRVRIVSDAGTPSGKAIEVNWFAGDGAGFKGAAFWDNWRSTVGDLKEFYIHVLFKYKSGWQQHKSFTTKVFYFGGGSTGAPTDFFPSFRAGPDPAILAINGQGSNGDRPIFRNTDGQSNMFTGVWQELEIYVRASSAPNAADGLMRIYLNGTEITSWSQLRQTTHGGQPNQAIWDWFGAESPWGFRGIQLGTYWGGGSDTKTQDDWMRWGGLYMSGKP